MDVLRSMNTNVKNVTKQKPQIVQSEKFIVNLVRVREAGNMIG
jgi:hypothetical protein